MDEWELWTGKVALSFHGLPPFIAPGRIWATLTPTPVSRLRISLEAAVEGIPHLQTGAATIRVEGSTYDHDVIVSRVESHALVGQFTGPPPLPSGDAVSIAFGVLNLDPKGLWLDETIADSWRFRLTADAELAGSRERLRDVLGVAETHGALLDRVGGGAFAAEDGLRVLDSWRLAMSFATGSRIGIWRQVLRRPLDGADDRWQAWASPSVEPWHDRHRIIDAHDGLGIRELFSLILARRASDPDRAAIDDLAINFALEANGTAPIEMRIASAGAGLELLAWDQLVEDAGDGTLTKAARKRSYADRSASENLALLLARAKIDATVPPILSPYASIDGGVASGAVAVASLRNRVMHPRRRDGELSLPGQVWAEGWQLAAQYLELLILHRLGYTGRYSDRFRSDWVGTTFDVPWATHAAPTFAP